MRDGKQTGRFEDSSNLSRVGLDSVMIAAAIEYTYRVLDALDATLIVANEPRMAALVELANLSAIMGNLFRGGLAQASGGRFVANGPHKYPDLLSNDARYRDLEIKVALEKNKPKGHLVKPGPHITVRYVLGDLDGSYRRGRERRGDVAWIWEVRVGILEDHHFSVSNTAGDSGKTAVFNKAGMAALAIAFIDPERSPTSARSSKSADSKTDPQWP